MGQGGPPGLVLHTVGPGSAKGPVSLTASRLQAKQAERSTHQGCWGARPALEGPRPGSLPLDMTGSRARYRERPPLPLTLTPRPGSCSLVGAAVLASRAALPPSPQAPHPPSPSHQPPARPPGPTPLRGLGTPGRSALPGAHLRMRVSAPSADSSQE